VDYFARPSHRELIEKLRRNGVQLAEQAKAEASGPLPLTGKTFVITGTLPSMSREAAAELIVRYGGKVTGSVSKNTTYLLAGDKPGANKTTDAAKLGVPTLDEAGLRGLIGNASAPAEEERKDKAEPTKGMGQMRLGL